MNTIQYGKKRKNIIKTIRAKVDSWLESIDDDKFRKLAKRDVLVTGGCIASMYLGERVNDFDIYFKTKETALAFALYYVEKARESCMIGDETAVFMDNDRIRIKIQSAGVAGELPENDQFDMDPSDLSLEDVVDQMDQPDKPLYRPVFISENAITLSDRIQVIIRFYGSPEEIHKNFDFVHATGCYDYYSDELTVSVRALESMLSRTLSYGGSLYPIASIFRVKKFLSRGWRIGAGDLLKIMFQISELNLKNIGVLEDQLTGVDVGYMFMLIEALKGVDPDRLNATYVAVLIDKIFG